MPKKNSNPFAPVELNLDSKLLAVATVKKKPSKRCPDPYWMMRICTQYKSKRIIINLGRYPRAQVLEKMLEAYQGQKSKDNPTSKLPSFSAKYPIDILLDEWYKRYVLARSPKSGIRKEFQLSPFTIRNYTTCINQLKTHGGYIDLASWTIGDFEDLKIALQQRYAPRTVHLAIAVLRRAIQWAEKREKPIRKIDLENKRPPRSQHVGNDRTPTAEEAKRIFDSIGASFFKIIYLLCWKTGARIGEIVDLEWDRIEEDSDGALLHLVGKTGARVVPIDHFTYQMILEFFEDQRQKGRLFGAHYRTNASGRLAEICKNLKIKPFTMHGLRRLRSDTLFRSNIEPAVYEALMGHSVRIAVEAYRRPDLADLKKASGILRVKSEPSLKELMVIAEKNGVDIRQLLEEYLLK